MNFFSSLVPAYGYAGVLVGTLLGGETVLLAAAYLAARGFLSLWLVMLFAGVGSYLSDLAYFLLGRSGRGLSILKRPRVARAAERVRGWAERHQDPLMLGFRFLYGARIATLLSLGASGVPLGKFLVFNLIGDIAWVLAYGLAGFWFGQAASGFLAQASHYEWIIVAAIIAVLIAARLLSLGVFSKKPDGN